MTFHHAVQDILFQGHRQGAWEGLTHAVDVQLAMPNSDDVGGGADKRTEGQQADSHDENYSFHD